jgi:hypothetical protein
MWCVLVKQRYLWESSAKDVRRAKLRLPLDSKYFYDNYERVDDV